MLMRVVVRLFFLGSVEDSGKKGGDFGWEGWRVTRARMIVVG